MTDTIETFTENGIRLTSGEELPADVVVTATGLNLLALGGIAVEVDGPDVDVNETIGYKGMMFSGVPNFAITLGYTNASWTLKCDLACEYVCRLLEHMDANGYDQVTPRTHDASLETVPFLDLRRATSRALDQFPRRARGRRGALPELRARHHDVEARRAGGQRDRVHQGAAVGARAGAARGLA